MDSAASSGELMEESPVGWLGCGGGVRKLYWVSSCQREMVSHGVDEVEVCGVEGSAG